MRVRAVLVAAAMATGVAACGSSSPVSQATQAAATATAPDITPAGSGPYQPSLPSPSPDCGNPVATLPPLPALPPPGAMPAGSYEAAIQKRGYLIAGVDQNTYLFAYGDPTTGQLSGFDIDTVRLIAQAIFGDAKPNHLHFVIVPNDQRTTAVQNGTVDVVAETMTINCARRQIVNFSAVYLEAGERLLVPKTSSVKSTKDLTASSRVCATAGSTSLVNLAALKPPPTLIQVKTQADCLVMLQQGQVDAVSTDDAILDGLAAQDPNLAVVGPQFSQEPYGLALPKAHPEYTSFVNSVLANEKANGTWAAIYGRWLAPSSGGTTPAPPTPVYSASAG